MNNEHLFHLPTRNQRASPLRQCNTDSPLERVF